MKKEIAIGILCLAVLIGGCGGKSKTDARRSKTSCVAVDACLEDGGEAIYPGDSMTVSLDGCEKDCTLFVETCGGRRVPVGVCPEDLESHPEIEVEIPPSVSGSVRILCGDEEVMEDLCVVPAAKTEAPEADQDAPSSETVRQVECAADTDCVYGAHCQDGNCTQTAPEAPVAAAVPPTHVLGSKVMMQFQLVMTPRIEAEKVPGLADVVHIEANIAGVDSIDELEEAYLYGPFGPNCTDHSSHWVTNERGTIITAPIDYLDLDSATECDEAANNCEGYAEPTGPVPFLQKLSRGIICRVDLKTPHADFYVRSVAYFTQYTLVARKRGTAETTKTASTPTLTASPVTLEVRSAVVSETEPVVSLDLYYQNQVRGTFAKILPAPEASSEHHYPATDGVGVDHYAKVPLEDIDWNCGFSGRCTGQVTVNVNGNGFMNGVFHKIKVVLSRPNLLDFNGGQQTNADCPTNDRDHCPGALQLHAKFERDWETNLIVGGNETSLAGGKCPWVKGVAILSAPYVDALYNSSSVPADAHTNGIPIENVTRDYQHFKWELKVTNYDDKLYTLGEVSRPYPAELFLRPKDLTPYDHHAQQEYYACNYRSENFDYDCGRWPKPDCVGIRTVYRGMSYQFEFGDSTESDKSSPLSRHVKRLSTTCPGKFEVKEKNDDQTYEYSGGSVDFDEYGQYKITFSGYPTSTTVDCGFTATFHSSEIEQELDLDPFQCRGTHSTPSGH